MGDLRPQTVPNSPASDDSTPAVKPAQQAGRDELLIDMKFGIANDVQMTRMRRRDRHLGHIARAGDESSE
jgi:hypothetical protein